MRILDKIKQEIVKGNSIYVQMSRTEKEQWERYKAIDTTFTFVERLRNSVPQNVKWVDKNVHKVIENIIDLKDRELGTIFQYF